jgi:hypothetical protein
VTANAGRAPRLRLPYQIDGTRRAWRVSIEYGERQTIELELNAASEANHNAGVVEFVGEFLCTPGLVKFDQPFLIVVRERESQRLRLVLWLDNAELVSRRPHWWPAILHAFG